MNNVSTSEIDSFVKFARHMAYTSDIIASSYIKFSEKLERANYIDPNRKSKKNRDDKLKKQRKSLECSDESLEQIAKQIGGNSDFEHIIQCVLRDVDVTKAKRVLKEQKKGE